MVSPLDQALLDAVDEIKRVLIAHRIREPGAIARVVEHLIAELCPNEIMFVTDEPTDEETE